MFTWYVVHCGCCSVVCCTRCLSFQQSCALWNVKNKPPKKNCQNSKSVTVDSSWFCPQVDSSFVARNGKWHSSPIVCDFQKKKKHTHAEQERGVFLCKTLKNFTRELINSRNIFHFCRFRRQGDHWESLQQENSENLGKANYGNSYIHTYIHASYV